MGHEFLLEIGTEEIPARFIPPVLEEMAVVFRQRLEGERLQVGEITTWGTPRRLTLVARDLATHQTEVTQEILGPPKNVAFDDAGQPTAAALGFARSQGVSLSDLITVETPKGLYLAVRRRLSGRPALEVLADLLPDFILGLTFPKSMRWGSQKITFARPIHWVLARLGGQVVPFAFADVTSGGVTYGHRFMAPEPREVKDAAEYVNTLRQAYVIVDPTERQALLEKELHQAAAQVGGEVIPNPGLLQENTFLVEYPSVVCGHFDEKFLALPEEVLITAMREHQRYFSLRGRDGKLLPHFLAVNNTLARNPDLVRQGHERVLRARLSDAMFFYQEDIKVPLEQRVEALKGVVFHSLLGTSYEKMERFRALALYLWENLEAEDRQTQAAVNPEVLQRAATLCKADLVTEMVGEFPSLQGVMGRVYASLLGERPEVAQAIDSHYLPRHAGDNLPPDLMGALVGLADRLDTICGSFGVGLTPTGAADPYGLRRHALAIIHILLAKGLHLDLAAAVAKSLELVQKKITRNPTETAQEVMEFFMTRLQHLLLGEGYDAETVAAVLAAGGRDVVALAGKVKALEEVRKSPEFPALALAFKRVINISQGAESIEVNPELLELPEEKQLFETAQTVAAEAAQAQGRRDYPAVCRALAKLKGPVDSFFERVLVMAENPQLRANRLALLKYISQTFLEMADFSKITT